MAIRAATAEAYQLLHEGALALAEVESHGVRVNVDYLERVNAELEQQIIQGENNLRRDRIYLLWRKKFGENTKLGSREQLGEIIFGVLKYPCLEYTPTGRYKANKEALQRVDLPFVRDYEKIETLKKAKNTFLAGLRRESWDGYFHPNFSLHTASTFRSSSGSDKEGLKGDVNSLNFQNLPVRNPLMAEIVRSCFIPRKGQRLVEIDLAGAEVTAAYWYHLDPVMYKYLTDPKSDMHRDMACQCYLLEPEQVSKDARYCAKNKAVFPFFYGSVYLQCAPALWDAILQMNLRVKQPGDEIGRAHV